MSLLLLCLFVVVGKADFGITVTVGVCGGSSSGGGSSGGSCSSGSGSWGGSGGSRSSGSSSCW